METVKTAMTYMSWMYFNSTPIVYQSNNMMIIITLIIANQYSETVPSHQV